MKDNILENIITKIELVCHKLSEIAEKEGTIENLSEKLNLQTDSLKEVLDDLRSEEVRNEIKHYSRLD